MRDFLVILIIFGSIPFILMRPHLGILMWTWISIMNPHRLTWGIAYEMPLAMIIGSVTIAAWLFSKEPKNISWSGISLLMLIFVVWTNITSIFAILPSEAWERSIQFDKIILMTFLTMILMNTERRLLALIWVAVGSIAFFAVKGGVYSLSTGLQGRVWGPPATFIEDNNALAMATVMILPLLYYLSQSTLNKWLRIGLYLSICLSVVSIVGSYSRGAFLGLIAIALVALLRSKRRIIYTLSLCMVLLVATPFVPQMWFDRMGTIENYELSGSAVSRIATWEFAIDIAKTHPVFGGGFGAFFDQRLYDQYRPEGDGKLYSAHSIYFQILGSQGFVGLFLFLILGAASFRANSWIHKQTKDRSKFAKENLCARMCTISLVAYSVCGAFLNLATWDFPYIVVAVVFLNKQQVARKLAIDTEQDSVNQNLTAANLSISRQPGKLQI